MNILELRMLRNPGTIALPLLLLALSGCGSSDEASGLIEAEKPPVHSNSSQNGNGASIGVSNLCWIEGTTPATLFVETTITDKSSGDEVPHFLGVELQPMQKVKKHEYTLGSAITANVDLADINSVDATDPETGQYPAIVTAVDLCAAGLMTNATSVNANLRIELYNSTNTYTNSMCTARDDNGLKIGGLGLCQGG